MDSKQAKLIYDTLGFKFVECNEPNIFHWVIGDKKGYFEYPNKAKNRFLPQLDRFETFIIYAGPYLQKRSFGYSCGIDQDGFFCCIFSFQLSSNGEPEEVYDIHGKENLFDAWGETLLKFIQSHIEVS